MNFIERLEKNREQVLQLGKLAKESQLMQSLGSINGLIDELVKSQYDELAMQHIADGLNARFTDKELIFMHLDDLEQIERHSTEAIEAAEATGDEPGAYDTAFLGNDNAHILGASEREDRLLEEYDYEHVADIVSDVVGTRERFETFLRTVEDGAYGKVSDEPNIGKLLKCLHGHVADLNSVEKGAPKQNLSNSIQGKNDG